MNEGEDNVRKFRDEYLKWCEVLIKTAGAVAVIGGILYFVAPYLLGLLPLGTVALHVWDFDKIRYGDMRKNPQHPVTVAVWTIACAVLGIIAFVTLPSEGTARTVVQSVLVCSLLGLFVHVLLFAIWLVGTISVLFVVDYRVQVRMRALLDQLPSESRRELLRKTGTDVGRAVHQIDAQWMSPPIYRLFDRTEESSSGEEQHGEQQTREAR